MTAQQRTTRVTDTAGVARGWDVDDGRGVVFFDIDNCLYSKHTKIPEMMKDRIRTYFRKIGLSEQEAKELHSKYYKQYGLAIRGLVQHHKVDPLDYDKECDASLPLETVLSPNAALASLLSSIDRSKYKVWALTNAFSPHAVRVLSLVGLSDQFTGIVSCDYSTPNFSCKPEAPFFAEAVEAAGQPDVSKLFFVDDSASNIRGATGLGWGACVCYDEDGDEGGKIKDIVGRTEDGRRVDVVRDMLDLRKTWPEVFKSEM